MGIVNAAVSEVPLFIEGWGRVDARTTAQGESKVAVGVKTMSLKDLLRDVDYQFDTIVADCEGCLRQIILDNPRMLDPINLIILENDYAVSSEWAELIGLLEGAQFRYVDCFPKGGHADFFDADWDPKEVRRLLCVGLEE